MELTAAAVLMTPTPVYAVFYLVLLFMESSVLLLWLGCEYLAMIFLMIYVGAIAVLFLFVIMMLNTRLLVLRELTITYIPVGGLILLCCTAIIFESLSPFLFDGPLGSVGWPLVLNQPDNIVLLGVKIYGDFASLFVLATMMLFVAMIGSIFLAFRESKGVRRQSAFSQHSRLNVKTLKLIKHQST